MLYKIEMIVKLSDLKIVEGIPRSWTGIIGCHLLTGKGSIKVEFLGHENIPWKFEAHELKWLVTCFFFSFSFNEIYSLYKFKVYNIMIIIYVK